MNHAAKKLATLVGAAVAITSVAVPATAASAAVGPLVTNPSCSSGTNYYQVINRDGPHCFANSGTLAVYITGVTELCPGNNIGRVYYNNSTWSPYRGKGGCYAFSGSVTVNRVQIQ